MPGESASCCCLDAIEPTSAGCESSSSSPVHDDADKVLVDRVDLKNALAFVSRLLLKTDADVGRGASRNALWTLSKESIVLPAMDLRLESSDNEARREYCEKREVAMVELYEGPIDGLLCPIASDDLGELLGRDSDVLCLRDCTRSVKDKVVSE